MIALIILVSCLKIFNGTPWPQNPVQPLELGIQGPHDTDLPHLNNISSHTPPYLHTAPMIQAGLFAIIFSVLLERFLLS